ncbi:MutS domain V [Cyclobacterium lianum]|uniref:MutS domain V n=1 Tax=Cyclobacterium lianum TaxID=388280 RepID=A0A1M7I6F4_9BACT|nr:DNA mismatch repair protein [Cyclobacterium lianum]SHM36275.1 MutS domain V [Cyclobacterium lianum]
MNTAFDLSDPEKSLAMARKRILLLSGARLIMFFLMGIVLVVGIAEAHWIALVFIPLSGVFVWLILQFNQQKDIEHFYLAVKEIAQARTRRKERQLTEFDGGEVFIDPGHPFSSDLDLFGNHSLFQLIDHTVSRGGSRKLASWMQWPLSPGQAQQKQEALTELSRKKKFLVVFEALGKAFLKQEKSKHLFYQWLNSKVNWKQAFLLPMVFGPIAGMSLLIAVLFGYISAAYISLYILISLGLLSVVFSPLLKAMKAMPNDHDLKTFQAWAALLEAEHFDHPILEAYQKPVKNHGFLASNALKQLESLTFLIQNRTNLMYLIFNVFFWTDFYVFYRLTSWKEKVGKNMQLWEENFESWEALVSLAAFIEEEDLVYPAQWSNENILRMKAVKHPLIKPEECIANDFSLGETQQVVLLTGSNMSGKTTFMRTVGINMVLAGMGVPPFARFFQSGPFQLYTSMRNTDSLGESVSSFYAELARIKGLLDQAAKGVPLFYLLDEILKGTNTADRIMGSEALIHQLVQTASRGIISTHDIELSGLERKLPSLVNYSFHHDIQQDEIVFDYTIKPGPCPNFNAQKLMELMGIKIK